MAETKNDFACSRNFKHLRIFVQLRDSLGAQFERAMESVSTFFKEEKDYLYRKGEAKGEAKKNYIIVENLIVKLRLSDEQAAEVAEVEVEFVKKVRAELKITNTNKAL